MAREKEFENRVREEGERRGEINRERERQRERDTQTYTDTHTRRDRKDTERQGFVLASY